MAHVLIVDDDALVRRSLERTLRREHTISLAADIEEAKRLMVGSDENIDVVVSDLMMPGGTGLDLYLWVQENRPPLADRFMICTGGGPSEVLDRLKKTPVSVYAKPVSAQDLREAVQKLVTPGEPRSPSNPP